MPLALTHLSFGANFNQNVDNVFPPTLTHLSFGNNFNYPVDHLPSSLIELKFAGLFNHPINRLPSTLSQLTLSYMFDQAVDHLPPSLTHLTFGKHFNNSIDHLPKYITHLVIPAISSFESKVTVLPPNLILLEIPRLEIPVPPSLINAIIGYSNTTYPATLKRLEIRENACEWAIPPCLEILKYNGNIEASLPQTLTQLRMWMMESTTMHQIQCIFALPSLIELHLRVFSLKNVDKSASFSLPPRLSRITLMSSPSEPGFGDFVSAIDFLSAPLTDVSIAGPAKMPKFPNTVTFLNLRELDGPLPPHLEIFNMFGTNSPTIVSEFLPASLTELRLHGCITFSDLPPALKVAQIFLSIPDQVLCYGFPQSLLVINVREFFINADTKLPPNLVELYVSASSLKDIPPLPLTIESASIEIRESMIQ